MVKSDFRSLLLFGLFTSRNKPKSLISKEFRDTRFVITKLAVESNGVDLYLNGNIFFFSLLVVNKICK